MRAWQVLYVRSRGLFKRLGSEGGGASVRDPDSLERISRALEGVGPRAPYLASFAYVLARVAHADADISEEELGVMQDLVERVAGLSADHARVAVEVARSRALALGGQENYVVTRRFRELSTRDERIKLLECLFAVAAADREITTVENHEISTIASELGFSPQEVTQVRSGFREHLSVLKNLPKGDAGA